MNLDKQHSKPFVKLPTRGKFVWEIHYYQWLKSLLSFCKKKLKSNKDVATSTSWPKNSKAHQSNPIYTTGQAKDQRWWWFEAKFLDWDYNTSWAHPYAIKVIASRFNETKTWLTLDFCMESNHFKSFELITGNSEKSIEVIQSI